MSNMALNAEEIKQFGDSKATELAEAIKRNASATLQWREQGTKVTPSGKTIATVIKRDAKPADFLGWFQERVTQSVKDGTTVQMDHLISTMFKPTFPYKQWMLDYINESDRLNKDGLVKNAGLALTKSVFTSSELDDFFEFAQHACADAPQFQSAIAENVDASKGRDYYYDVQILNRAFCAGEDGTRGRYQETAKTCAPGDRSTFTRALDFIGPAKSVYDATKAGKLGICTTFAWAAAAPLLTRMQKEKTSSDSVSALKRVEVVAFTNHIFCIVNRSGAVLTRNQALPGASAWGSDVIQVDAWMGTLGWPYVFEGTSGSNQCFFNPLKSLFDSDNVTW